MKLEISTLNKKELAKFSGIANGRSPLPILSNLLLNAAGDKLTITATNLEVGVIHDFDATISEEGITTVACKGFVDIIDRLNTNEPIIITSTDRNINIQQGDSKFKLHTLSGDDYPETAVHDGQSIEIDQSLFFQAIKRVFYAASTDSSRFNLNTIFIDSDVMVATDGHRLSKSDLPFNINCKIMLPTLACNTITKAFQGTGPATLTISDKWAGVSTGDVKILTRLPDGEYPDWRKVITTDNQPSLALVARAELLKAIRRVAPLSTNHDMGVTVNVDNKLIKISKQSELGSGEDSVPCEYEGSFEFICNLKYIQEAVTNIESDNVLIGYAKDGAPVTITPEVDTSHFSLVMPMRK